MKAKVNITFFLLIIFLVVICLFGACNDEIFYYISKEFEIKDPIIKGSPTNLVYLKSEQKIYVAAGKKLYNYNKDDGWPEKPLNIMNDKKEMNIGQLAATDNDLYALCYEDKSGEITQKILKRNADVWEEIPKITGDYTIPQAIYAANNTLYIGAQKRNTNDYAVHVLNSSGVLQEDNIPKRDPAADKREPVTLLNGACYNGTNVFLCTTSGIFIDGAVIKYTLDDGKSIKGANHNFSGIITLPDNTVAAITREGRLYKVEVSRLIDDPDEEGEKIDVPVVVYITRIPGGRYTTGAIATWKDSKDPEKNLLLVGRTDYEYTTTTGHTYGYMELVLSAQGAFELEKEDYGFKEPGEIIDNTTVGDRHRYSASMGAIPINSFIQLPVEVDPEMPIFASTQKEGVWSCRERGTEDEKTREWNAED